jgi:hypothetical protein
VTLCSCVVKHQCLEEPAASVRNGLEEPAANVRNGLAVGHVAWIRAGSTSTLALGEREGDRATSRGLCAGNRNKSFEHYYKRRAFRQSLGGSSQSVCIVFRDNHFHPLRV